jgi:arsenate reductase (thioredoxin)
MPQSRNGGVEDPAQVVGSEAERIKAFVRAFQLLKSRIDTFLDLPLASLDRFTIGTRLQAIGHLEGARVLPASGADRQQR